MIRKVIVRPAAQRDLDEQADYTAADSSIEVALRFYRRAGETFRLLAMHPRMGRSIELLNPFFANARVFPMKNFSQHMVSYRPAGRGIEILRIIHGSRDTKTLLEG